MFCQHMHIHICSSQHSVTSPLCLAMRQAAPPGSSSLHSSKQMHHCVSSSSDKCSRPYMHSRACSGGINAINLAWCACRNILKTNDVRTGLKKPEQEVKKRAASGEPAQLAEASQAVDVSRPEPAQDADASRAERHKSSTISNAAAATLDGAGNTQAATSEWDVAKAARDRCAPSTSGIPAE